MGFHSAFKGLIQHLVSSLSVSDLPVHRMRKNCFQQFFLILCTGRSFTESDDTRCCINLLKPAGYVMHQQFNIQQLYALPTQYLCVLYLSVNKQRLVPLTAQTDWFL